MSVVVPDSVAIGVAAILAKEGLGLVKWAFGKKKPNGKETAEAIKGLLNDIKGTGKLTYEKVQTVEKEQALMTTKVAVIANTVGGFEERCSMHMESVTKTTDELGKRVDQLDSRVFDLQKGR